MLDQPIDFIQFIFTFLGQIKLFLFFKKDTAQNHCTNFLTYSLSNKIRSKQNYYSENYTFVVVSKTVKTNHQQYLYIEIRFKLEIK